MNPPAPNPTAPNATAPNPMAVNPTGRAQNTAPVPSVDAVAADALLRIEHLSVAFTQYTRGLRQRLLTPVTDMTLHARAGEVTALVGASGSGKTLLGLAVLGLLPSNAQVSGRLDFDGSALTPQRQQRLRGHELSMLPQAVSHLDPTARVNRQVGRALQLAGREANETSAVLAEQGLASEVGRRYPHELSGGMARRVLLAMSLAASPRLLIADEPTPGLDPALARSTMSALRAVADAGRAVVLVSHDLVEALRIADRVVITHEGRTLEEAVPGQFSGAGDSLTHPYSRALWRALPGNGFHRPVAPEAVRAGGGPAIGATVSPVVGALVGEVG